MGGVEATWFPGGNHAVNRHPPTRVRTDFKYGRDRGRSLAAIQCGQAASAVFRQALLLEGAELARALDRRLS